VITAVIPTHPERVNNGMLGRAVLSVHEQVFPASQLVVELDDQGAGAAATRQAGLERVATPWVAFLDSDDWWYPEHLAVLAQAADAEQADYVFSYFTVHDAWEGMRPDVDPLGTFGRPFDPDEPHQTTVTVLVRTDLARTAGFRAQPPDRLIPGTNLRHGEDWQFTLDCLAAGAKIIHVPRRTWAWRHHGLNTGGLSGEGDAR
jgi:glycosyltransferase involved in cell wall biosynthesis